MAKKKKPLGSLRDQLKDAGLVTAKQARKAEKGAIRADLRIKKGVEVDTSKQEVEALRKQKAAEDRARNVTMNEQSRERAMHAQVRQLVRSNSQRQDGEVAYNFTVDKKIKKLYVSEENKRQLNKGFLAIVQAGDEFDLVPEVVAQKIAARLPEAVLFLHDRSGQEVDEDDPYKDFPIPDDLEW